MLEIIARPYGSGGTSATNPHPLVAPEIHPDHEPDATGDDSSGADPAKESGARLSADEGP